MPFAVYRVEVDAMGNRGSRERAVARVFEERTEAIDYIVRLVRAFQKCGVNDEQGLWWAGHNDGRKTLFFVEGVGPNVQSSTGHGEPLR